MIQVYMRGRLGNQMFQYAFVRSLQLQSPEQEIQYNFNDVYNSGSADDGWENALNYFNVIDVNEDNKSIHLSIAQKTVMKLYWKSFPHNASIETINRYQMKWIDIMNRVGLYYLDLGYYSFNKICKGNIIVSGNFESEKYFSDISGILKKEFVPKQPVMKRNIELFNLINDTNSICVSIRRGDFVENADNSRLLNVCTKGYFIKGINYLKEKVSDATFFFFSDDIEWVKKEFCMLDIPFYCETGNDPVWEKLRLMYTCKHFLISNSTFSWWAQYLGRKEYTIVVAPKRWYNSTFVPDIIQDDWIRI